MTVSIEDSPWSGGREGLPTLAVVVTGFFHVGVHGESNAFIMLDLFFVLSGVLVTNVVLAEVHARGGFRVGQNFVRRARARGETSDHP